ncbi:MAG TPA: Calx-beta domain-containing protein, partial [Pyrinomonadaceae bacterium]|nr:Calx-beta domain-containing protein [Pyrinomonadaceae bacterium]
MSGSPRPSALYGARFGAKSTLLHAALCLLVFAASASAQQLSIPGIKGTGDKEASAQKQIPIEIRAEQGLAPLGRLYDFIKVESYRVRRLPALSESRIREGMPEEKRFRIGTVRTFLRAPDVLADSALYHLPDGEVRVMGVVSEGALFTRLHFTEMSLPAGARVFVYSLKNPEEFYGPYEGRGPTGDGTFWTPPMEGDSVAVEYFTPAGVRVTQQDAPFRVSEVSHTYRDLLAGQGGTEDIAGACNLEVTSNWSEVAKSVGQLRFTSGNSEYACTGTLLNNSSNDQTPYLLTANHCFDTQIEAQSLRVYWNYNSGDFPPLGTPSTDGANLLATGAASDFTLVRLTGSLPSGLFFSGWDATSTPVSTSVTGIHHPQASHKRLSLGTTVSDCGGGFPFGNCQNFTAVRWNSGTTEGGSSGSGIWTGSPSDARLVGTLTGGGASCSSPTLSDYYGRFSVTYPSIASFLQHGDNGPDDNLEENDTRSTARALQNGTYGNLVIKGTDEDWYKVSVAAGGILGFRLNYAQSGGNINMQLFQGSDASPVSLVNSTSVVQVNQTGATADYYLRVFTTPSVQNNYSLTVGGAGAICAPTPISYGQTINGSLSTSDCQSGLRVANFNGNFFSDRYSFNAVQGQEVSITLTPATSFNTYMVVQGIVGQVVYTDLPGSPKQGSLAQFTAPGSGTYTIEVSAYDAGVTGNYQLTLTEQPDVMTISQSEYSVGEGAGSVAVTINRGPNATGPASVDYFTSDFSGLNECSKVTGSASPRCDYANSMGTLRFAPGEKSKTVYIPLVDDSFAEGMESFEFYITNPVGAGNGSNTRAFILINDNDSSAGANPLDQTPFFVRQHYIDLLGREPDPAGFQGWQNILNGCGTTVAQPCDRIEVSSAFFRSEEFQNRGYFVYRFYSAVGKIPLYEQFMPDLAKVSGFLSAQELENNKLAFINEFMARTDYQTRYAGITDNTAYVDTLLGTLGLPNHSGRQGWINALNTGTSRAVV